MSARYEFTSDNTAGACPQALAALLASNGGFAPGYGRDAMTRQAADAVRNLLDADVEVFFVTSGTAANAIACAMLAAPHEAVLAHEHAHLITHEAGAAGFLGHGLKVQGVPGSSGRIDDAALLEALQLQNVLTYQAPAAISITQATEYGTLYSSDALQTIAGLATESGCRLHVDGARLANAAAAGFDVRHIASCNVSILSLGGTKAGGFVSDAIVLFDKSASRGMAARLKQAGQLCSRSRFLAAPWIALLDGAGPEEMPWVRHAAHANAMAARLAAGMPFLIRHPVEANGVFVDMSDASYQQLNEWGWKVARAADGSVRFMCSWAVTQAAVDDLLSDLARLNSSGATAF